MSNELTTINNNFPSQIELQSISLIARTAHTSGLYSGVGGEAKIMMILLAAKELGVGPCLALNGGIWNIQGKIEISARLMNSLIRRAGHSITIKKSDDKSCVLLGKRRDGDSFECEFTIEEANKAGLSSRDVWKKYTSDMLYNRCMSRLARRLFSDVIGNCYIEGEVRDAIEMEKLQTAECEEIQQNNPKKQDEKCVNLSQNQETEEKQDFGPKIDEIQILKFKEMECMIDQTIKEKIWKQLKSQYNAEKAEDIPLKAYEGLLNVMGMNIEMNLKKATA